MESNVKNFYLSYTMLQLNPSMYIREGIETDKISGKTIGLCSDKTAIVCDRVNTVQLPVSSV